MSGDFAYSLLEVLVCELWQLLIKSVTNVYEEHLGSRTSVMSVVSVCPHGIHVHGIQPHLTPPLGLSPHVGHSLELHLIILWVLFASESSVLL